MILKTFIFKAVLNNGYIKCDDLSDDVKFKIGKSVFIMTVNDIKLFRVLLEKIIFEKDKFIEDEGKQSN